MINLRPLLSLQVQCYPECIEEVRPRYKSAAAERWTWSRQCELYHCSIVYTVPTTNQVHIGHLRSTRPNVMTMPIHLMLECDHMQNGNLSGTWLRNNHRISLTILLLFCTLGSIDPEG